MIREQTHPSSEQDWRELVADFVLWLCDRERRGKIQHVGMAIPVSVCDKLKRVLLLTKTDCVLSYRSKEEWCTHSK